MSLYFHENTGVITFEVPQLRAAVEGSILGQALKCNPGIEQLNDSLNTFVQCLMKGVINDPSLHFVQALHYHYYVGLARLDFLLSNNFIV